MLDDKIKSENEGLLNTTLSGDLPLQPTIFYEPKVSDSKQIYGNINKVEVETEYAMAKCCGCRKC